MPGRKRNKPSSKRRTIRIPPPDAVFHHILLFFLAVCTWAYFDVCVLDDVSESILQSAEFSFDEPSRSTVDTAPSLIPEYDGTVCIPLNHNIPNFTEYDLSHMAGENYSELDYQGRCGTASARLDRTMMPTGERGDIRDVRPSGWRQRQYPGIVDEDPPYLYNRCHLIAWALTGQNANEKNLITGTRYMNKELMLPYEIQVARYLDHSSNHVLYRVSPYFRGQELLARGVELEALSVEDGGSGLCFHVFVYNVQPGIKIDYTDGWSGRLSDQNAGTADETMDTYQSEAA